MNEDTLIVALCDSSEVIAPLSWHPRLRHGTDAERANWRLIGTGVGVYWPDLDEDIGIEGLVLGKRSRESGVSLTGWLAKYIGTSPEFWLNLQMRWDVYFARQAEAAELAVIEPLVVHD